MDQGYFAPGRGLYQLDRGFRQFVRPTYPFLSQVARARLSGILQDLEALGVGQDNLNDGTYEVWGWRCLTVTMGVSTYNTPKFHKIMT
jgi:hypothetical protein